MGKWTLILLCGGMLAGCAARTGTFADSVCADLRAQRPSYAGPIGVTCRAPARTTYFRCNALDGATGLPVDAEAIDDGCVHPWGV